MDSPPRLFVESGAQLFSRTTSIQKRCGLDGIRPEIFLEGGPYNNQIIEVCGNSKANFMLDFIIRTILPKNLDESFKETGVAIIHTDFYLDIIKLTRSLDKVLKKFKLHPTYKKGILEDSLKKIHIIECFNGQEFKTVLRDIEELLRNKNVGLLVIENIGTQYWTLSLEEETSYYFYCKKNLTSLQNIIKDLKLIILFARDDSFVDLKISDYKILVNSDDEAQIKNYETDDEYFVEIELF